MKLSNNVNDAIIVILLMVSPLFMLLLMVWEIPLFRNKVDYLESRISRKSFEFFNMLSEQKLSVWIILCRVIMTCLLIITPVVYTIIWPNFYQELKFDDLTTVLSCLMISCAATSCCLIWILVSRRWKADKLVIKLKHISPKIDFLKKYQFSNPATDGNKSLTKSVAFLINSPQLDLTKKNTKKVLRQIYRLLIFFSKSVKHGLDFKNKSYRCILLEMIKNFDEFLNDCKFEVKILQLCLYSINKHRLTKNLWISDQNSCE